MARLYVDSKHKTILLAFHQKSTMRAVDVCKEDNRSFLWQFIAYYYSGYFAVNALVRLCGYACANINAMDCTEISQSALLYGLGGAEEKKDSSWRILFDYYSLSRRYVSVELKVVYMFSFGRGFLNFSWN